ncbi:MupA/Atu3671 family FMN-dependent luciferase-like monooxygenase [Pleionea sediminis]|uniref:MupA/Atu3671 family FMN-dependent luciferase-like monooxygenase n=1 Tax=Pleionea sediminis TaxID=2569479 RepID=UPI0011864709|nr:MupA/Atu3671 family FMN-dependent luciferase-like monooxygenase [Pleionea sediminis]
MNKKQVKFSLMFFGASKAKDYRAYYDFVIQASRFADQHGFENIWLPERHFTDLGDVFSNPAIVHAALARETSRIGLRAGSAVATLKDPLLIAEEWSIVDQLSNGRAGVALASGWNPNDFAIAPENYSNRHALLEQRITEIRSLWQGDKVTKLNGVGETVNLEIHPKPLSRIPVWITAARSPDTFEMAGRLGANVLTHMLDQGLDSVKNNIALYRKARAENGFDRGQVTLAAHTFLSHEKSQVDAVAKEPYCNFLDSNLGLLNSLAKSRGHDFDVSSLSKTERRDFVEFIYERFRSSRALIGTLDECQPLLSEIAESGVDEIACMVDFGQELAAIVDGLPNIASYIASQNETNKDYQDQPEVVFLERACSEYIDTQKNINQQERLVFDGVSSCSVFDKSRLIDSVLDFSKVSVNENEHTINVVASYQSKTVAVANLLTFIAEKESRKLENKLNPPEQVCHQTLENFDDGFYQIDWVPDEIDLSQGNESDREFIVLLFDKAECNRFQSSKHYQVFGKENLTVSTDDDLQFSFDALFSSLVNGSHLVLYANSLTKHWSSHTLWQIKTIVQKLAQVDKIKVQVSLLIEENADQGDTPSIETVAYSASLQGLSRTLRAEYPSVWFYTIETDTKTPDHKIISLLAKREQTDLEYKLVAGDARVRRLVPAQSKATPVYIHENGTYLITGGLSDLGQFTAQKIIDSGAKYLLLFSRNAESTGRDFAKTLESQGVRIALYSGDVASASNLNDAKVYIESLGFPPVIGIFHAAGAKVKIDSLESHSELEIESVMEPKVAGVTALSESFDFNEIEFVCAFSSWASSFSDVAQKLGAYAAANFAMNQMLSELDCHFNAKCLSISWGDWGGTRVRQVAEQEGISLLPESWTFDPELGTNALINALKYFSAQVLFVPIDWNSYLELFPSRTNQSLLVELIQDSTNLSQGIRQVDSSELTNKLIELVKRRSPKSSHQKDINKLGLQDLGFDSIMSLELRAQVIKEFGIELPIVTYVSNKSIDELVALIKVSVNEDYSLIEEDLVEVEF